MAKSKSKAWSEEDEALLAELGEVVEAPKAIKYTPTQERIIAGFEDIQRFVREHGRLPQHGEDRDIFERLYAVRLDRIRALQECRELLEPLDADGLLNASVDADIEEMSDEDLLESLGVEGETTEDITVMKHVRPIADRKAAEEVAQRKTCVDFETFRPAFETVQQQLASGERQTEPFRHEKQFKVGDMFILDGQKVLVADTGETVMKEFDREDGRMRVIFDNGTESNLLRRSLQRAMYKDPNGRRILPPNVEAGPLFSDVVAEDDTASGTIYVARSLSDHPFVREHRDVLHKIGVTGGDAKARVAGAKKDPTFLLAEAELKKHYKLANVNSKKLEAILHRFFVAARLDLDLKDRFGEAVEPREWFLVPLPAIDEAIERIKDGSIGNYQYDPKSARIVRL